MSFLRETGRLLMKLGISPLLRIRQRDFVLRFYPSSISLVLWVNACRGITCFEEDERFYRRYLRAGDVVVDAGANIGFFSMLSAALVGPTGRVYAIEAHPKVAGYLRGNAACNGFENVAIHAVALGEKEGMLRLSDQKRDDRNMVVAAGEGIEVPVKRLDALGIEEERVALLKIDVEGYEKYVLEGAGELLERVDCLYFESCNVFFDEFGYRSSELFQLLLKQGFEIFRIEGERILAVSAEHQSEVCENLIAVREVGDFLERTGFVIKETD